MTKARTREIRDRIDRLEERYGDAAPARVMAQMVIEPVLRDLGWDTSDFSEVNPDNPAPEGGLCYTLDVDGFGFALMVPPRASDLYDDADWTDNAAKIARESGWEWCVLTNGTDWTLVNTFSHDLWLLLQCNLRKGAIENLELLSREACRNAMLRQTAEKNRSHGLIKDSLAALLTDKRFLAEGLCQKLPDMPPELINQAIKAFQIDVAIDGEPVPVPEGNDPPEDDGERDIPEKDRAEMKRIANLIRAEIERVSGSDLVRVKRYQSLFAASDFSVAAYISMSSPKEKSGREYYWWTPRVALDTLSDNSHITYLGLGMADSDEFFLIPYETYLELRPQLNASKRGTEDQGWHLYATRLDGGSYWLCRNDSIAEPILRLDDYTVSLDPEVRDDDAGPSARP